MENKKYTELLDDELNKVSGGMAIKKEELASRGSNGVIMITSDQSMNALNEVNRGAQPKSGVRFDAGARFDEEARAIRGRKADITGSVSSLVAAAVERRYPGK